MSKPDGSWVAPGPELDDDLDDAPALPWDGRAVPVPQYMKGAPVVCAIKFFTIPGEETAHQWALVIEDSPGKFSTLHIVWLGAGYKVQDAKTGMEYRDAKTGMEYSAAIEEMMKMAGLSGAPAGGVKNSEYTCAKLAYALGAKGGSKDSEVMLRADDGGLFTIGAIEERVVDGRSVVVIEIGEWLGQMT